MNLILLHPADFTQPERAVLRDRRFHHIRQVQQPALGSWLKVGVVNGKVGRAQVLALDDSHIELAVELLRAPPAPLPLTLIMALPRPKMLKRTLETASAMGVKQLYLINSYRVDKSFWSTPLLSEEKITEHLTLGLEQAGDTLMPKVHLRKRFKPFVEDELPTIAANSRALVAHPYEAALCPEAENTPTTLAVGPEGGFIAYEVEKLIEAGFDAVHIGERILRVENAVPVLLARLFPVL